MNKRLLLGVAGGVIGLSAVALVKLGKPVNTSLCNRHVLVDNAAAKENVTRLAENKGGG